MKKRRKYMCRKSSRLIDLYCHQIKGRPIKMSLIIEGKEHSSTAQDNETIIVLFLNSFSIYTGCFVGY